MLQEMAGLGFEYVELSHGVRITLVPGILKAVEEGVIKIATCHNFCPLPTGVTHAAPNLYMPSSRDPREREREGKIPGAFHCTRGMLEFWIDPESPYHKPQFAEDKTFVFFCAGGWRSALAAQTAAKMGLKPVAHIRGGFGEWKKSGAPIEPPEPQKP